MDKINCFKPRLIENSAYFVTFGISLKVRPFSAHLEVITAFTFIMKVFWEQASNYETNTLGF